MRDLLMGQEVRSWIVSSGILFSLVSSGVSHRIVSQSRMEKTQKRWNEWSETQKAFRRSVC